MALLGPGGTSRQLMGGREVMYVFMHLSLVGSKGILPCMVGGDDIARTNERMKLFRDRANVTVVQWLLYVSFLL